MALVFIGVGLALLLLGSGALVRGSLGLFRGMGVSPLLASLVIVSAAVSAPELFVSLQAGMRDHASVALGMLIGSSLANILLILGLGAMLGSMPVPPKVVYRDGAFLIAAAGALVFFTRTGTIGALSGAMLLAGFFFYVAVCFFTERGRHAPVRMASPYAIASEPEQRTSSSGGFFMLLLGLGLLFFGSRFVIDAGLSAARANGISETTAGLVLIALATALPELFMTIVAVSRRQAQATASQLIGSSIFNLTLVLGVLALTGPIAVDPVFARTDVFVLLAAALAIPLFSTSWRVSRIGGLLLFACYVGWVGFVAFRDGLLPLPL